MLENNGILKLKRRNGRMVVVNEGTKEIYENEIKESEIDMCETDSASCGMGN